MNRDGQKERPRTATVGPVTLLQRFDASVQLQETQLLQSELKKDGGND